MGALAVRTVRTGKACMTNQVVSDATKPWRFLIDSSDQIGAVQCDPFRCVVYKAIMRVGSTRRPKVINANVGQTIVLVELSTWTVVRYQIDLITDAAIRAYDTAGTLLPHGFPVTLIPPQVSSVAVVALGPVRISPGPVRT